MNTRLKYFSFILLLMCSMNTFSQDWQPRVVYWFKCNIAKQRNNKTMSYGFIIRPGGDFIFSGSVDDFSEDLWAEYRNRKLIIGPFWDTDMAQLALETYRNKYRKVDKIINKNKITVYWFSADVIPKRGYLAISINNPSIFSGIVDEFSSEIENRTDENSILVGPFQNEKAAQLALNQIKRLR